MSTTLSPRPASLQGRLLALVLGGVASVWLLAAAWTWLDVQHELDELLDSHLAQAAALLVVQQARELGDDEDGREQGLDAPTLHRYAPKVAFQVFHEGRLALRSANAPAAPMLAGPPGSISGFQTISMAGATWRVFATHGQERDVQVYVGEQTASRSAILWAVLRGTLAPMGLALPLLALAVWWAVRQGVAPLRRLGRTLADRQPQALHPLALEDAPVEMLPMLRALNGLFDRIGELMASERRFTADAAHELRTPIAAIRTQAQVALGETDAVLRRHALQATLQGCDRATRVVEQLLTLSRLEASGQASTQAGTTGGMQPGSALADLSALVRQVVAELAPRAIEQQQTLELHADSPCPVPGDATLLAILARNLVDNALRYSPTGSMVRVSVQCTAASSVQLTVEDSGPGMSEPDMQRLGERFFRVVGNSQPGSGLGWSIVRRIASVQRASVAVSPSPGLGGLRVDVVWPGA